MTGYSVSVLENNTQWEEMHYSTDQLSKGFQLGGLLPGTVYTLTVAGLTELTAAARVSNYSDEITIATLPAQGRKDFQQRISVTFFLSKNFVDIKSVEFILHIQSECEDWIVRIGKGSVE